MARTWNTAAPGRPAKGRRHIASLILCVAALICTASGCITRRQKTEKIREIEFTVTDKEMVPAEFKTVIEEKKAEPFKLTYADQGILYIAEGYGTQPTTGYSVEVEELYETEDAVHIHTNLMGPEKGEETKEIATFPYVVVQLDDIKKDVLFD
ncbi:protease complex subunit PrcB family protein [Clostridium sp. Marseille-P3244]|uniref:protease complex subunit PrcB family protein n=1 Tax=Clostridium sp. Marseille-P3244 TaxID=1871020 RepID=UPI000931D42D|nr:protease complex subunit PrcB family protein [Clostridium sp. Marseille-P3244]